MHFKSTNERGMCLYKKRNTSTAECALGQAPSEGLCMGCKALLFYVVAGAAFVVDAGDDRNHSLSLIK